MPEVNIKSSLSKVKGGDFYTYKERARAFQHSKPSSTNPSNPTSTDSDWPPSRCPNRPGNPTLASPTVWLWLIKCTTLLRLLSVGRDMHANSKARATYLEGADPQLRRPEAMRQAQQEETTCLNQAFSKAWMGLGLLSIMNRHSRSSRRSIFGSGPRD